MLSGLDLLSRGPYSALRRRVRGTGVAVLTHAAAIDRRGLSALVCLEELGASPQVVFTPEHGFDAAAQAFEPVADSADHVGARHVSLYGDTKASLSPRPGDFEGVELLVVDVVDVGSRYYTYVWTALLAARAAAAAGVHVVVLDRANPISGDPSLVEGVEQSAGFLSFVGLEPLPVRHSMTVAEVLVTCFARDDRPLGRDGALSVVPVEGWERFQSADAWGIPFVMPSPNMPTLQTALVYPGGCLLEGTNLSEGRGTTAPFQIVGAPWLDGASLAQVLVDSGLRGFMARPVGFRPTFDKHAGESCSGVMLHVTDWRAFRPLATYLTLISAARAQAPERFRFRTEPYEFEDSIPAFDLLTGSSRAREALEAGAPASEVVDLVEAVSRDSRDAVYEAEDRAHAARA